MANRKITQFPAIQGNQIASGDLFTLVAVDEVNPTLKNKKITSSQFVSGYLDQYFVSKAGGGGGQTFNGDVVISGSLTVSGHTVLNSLNVTGTSTTQLGGDLLVTGNITATENITGFLFSGNTMRANEGDFNFLNVQTSGNFQGPVQVDDGLTAFFITGTQNINGLRQVQSPMGLFTNITGERATFTVNLSGQTITGDTIRATTGIFQVISGASGEFDDVVVNGNIEFKSDIIIDRNVSISGNLTVSGDITSSGTISGVSGVFGTIIADTGIFREMLSGQTITGQNLQISNSAQISGQQLATLREAQNQAIIFAIALG